jgi:hypothetical protein
MLCAALLVAAAVPISARGAKALPPLETDYKQVASLLTKADVWIMPQPKAVAVTGDSFDLKACRGIRLIGKGAQASNFTTDFPALLKERAGVSLKASPGRPMPGCIVLGLFPDGEPADGFPGVTAADLKGLGDQGYWLRIERNGIAAAATNQLGLYYATRTIAQIAADRTKLPGLIIRDWPSMRYRGAHEDISRGQVPTTHTLKRLAQVIAEAKMNVMELYIEHLFKWKKHPDIAPPEAISAEEGRNLFDFASRYHIEVHPMLQVLGHSYGILHLPQYQHLRISESKKAPWIMTFDIRKPEAISFVNDLVQEVCDAFPGTFLNVDITEIDIDGLRESGTTDEQTTELIYSYVLKLRDMVRPRGMRLMIAQAGVGEIGHLGGLGPKLDLLPKDVIIGS